MRELMEPVLAERTTLRLGGKAIAELILEDMADIKALPERCAALGGKPLIMGMGSNMLARGGEIPIVLVKPALHSRLEIWARSGDKILVRASASVPMNKVLRFCLQNELGGLEGLVGIPGNVGGLTAMNAGSFGTEISDHIHSILVWTGSNLKMVSRHDLLPGYRSLKIKNLSNDFIILETIFALTGLPKSVIFKKMNLNFLEKKSRQPVTSASAGCTFKNPPGALSAGKMLDNAGFRGRKLGGMAFSAKHANFMINEGKGSEDAAFELMAMAQDKVFNEFGVKLEPEVKIIA